MSEDKQYPAPQPHVMGVRERTIEEAAQAVEARIQSYEAAYETATDKAKAMNLVAIAALSAAVITIRALSTEASDG